MPAYRARLELAPKNPETATLSFCQGWPLEGTGSHLESWPLVPCQYPSEKNADDGSACLEMSPLGCLRPHQWNNYNSHKFTDISSRSLLSEHRSTFLSSRASVTVKAGWTAPDGTRICTGRLYVCLLVLLTRMQTEKLESPEHSPSVHRLGCPCFL